jgi:glycosyltransferase involved in cell wall biosynthesis
MNQLSASLASAKVALVYDRVNTPHGGAEKVLLALHQIFPDAPLFTSVYDSNKANWAKDFKVIPTFLQKIPGAKNNHRLLVGLMPIAFESLDFSEFDIVISISSAEAKGILTQPHQLHISYLLTPTRYLYSHQQHYLDSINSPIPGIRYLADIFLKYLKWWDLAAKDRPDNLIPISKLVSKRINKYYGRHSSPVVYPPIEIPTSVDSKEVAIANLKKTNLAKANPLLQKLLNQKFHLVVSRLIPYKRIDLAIKTCQGLEQNLLIIGDGPNLDQLQNLAAETSSQNFNILFLGQLDSSITNNFLTAASSLIMPGVEDFGITALEAVAHHTPPILHQDSGAAEQITHLKTGIHLQDATVNGLIKAIRQVEDIHFDPVVMTQSVKTVSTAAFQRKFKHLVAAMWKQHYEQS